MVREVDVFVAYPLDLELLVAGGRPRAMTRAGYVPGDPADAGRLVADLSVDARLALLKPLLAVAEAGGALQRARDDKQRQPDLTWSI